MLPNQSACHLVGKSETAAVLLKHPWLQHGLVELLGWNMHGVQVAEAPDLGLLLHPWKAHASQSPGLQPQYTRIKFLEHNLGNIFFPCDSIRCYQAAWLTDKIAAHRNLYNITL